MTVATGPAARLCFALTVATSILLTGARATVPPMMPGAVGGGKIDRGAAPAEWSAFSPSNEVGVANPWRGLADRVDVPYSDVVGQKT